LKLLAYLIKIFDKDNDKEPGEGDYHASPSFSHGSTPRKGINRGYKAKLVQSIIKAFKPLSRLPFLDKIFLFATTRVSTVLVYLTFTVAPA